MGLGLSVVNEQNVNKTPVSMKDFWMHWLAQAEMCILVNSVVDAVQHYVANIIFLYWWLYTPPVQSSFSHDI